MKRSWDHFTFGMHKGEQVIDVIKQDPSYILWVHQNVKWFPISDELVARARLNNSKNQAEGWVGDFDYSVGFDAWGYCL